MRYLILFLFLMICHVLKAQEHAFLTYGLGATNMDLSVKQTAHSFEYTNLNELYVAFLFEHDLNKNLAIEAGLENQFRGLAVNEKGIEGEAFSYRAGADYLVAPLRLKYKCPMGKVLQFVPQAGVNLGFRFPDYFDKLEPGNSRFFSVDLKKEFPQFFNVYELGLELDWFFTRSAHWKLSFLYRYGFSVGKIFDLQIQETEAKESIDIQSNGNYSQIGVGISYRISDLWNKRFGYSKLM